MTTQETCKDRITAEYKGRMTQLRKLWTLWQKDPEASDPDLGTWNEYGLGFDYVAPGTFEGQRAGYFRYQLSWGGPSDEFRFFVTPGRRAGSFDVLFIEYWFLDWFDGAKRTLRAGNDFDLLCEIFNDFEECEITRFEYEKATADA